MKNLWATYIRKSLQDENNKNYRLEYQREILPKYAQAQGWQYETFDEGIATAGDINRLPQLQKILKRLKEFEGILVIDYTRFSRDTSLRDYLNLINLCAEHNVKLATPQTIRNPAIDSEWTLMIVESTLSACEIKRMSGRLKEGKRAKRDKGGWLGGRPAIGYRYNTQKRKLELEPREAKLVLKACQLLVDNSISETVRKLQGNKNRLGTPIAPGHIKRIIAKLIFYSGQVINTKGDLIPGEQPAIISDKLRREITHALKYRLGNFRGFPNSKYLLTGLGIFRCNSCGASVNAVGLNRFIDHQYSYYVCRRRYLPSRQLKCQNNRPWRVDYINEKVIKAIIEKLQDVKVIKAEYEALKEWQRKSSKSTKTLALSNQIEEKEKEKHRLIKALKNPLLSKDKDIIAEIQEVNQEITNLSFQLRQLQIPLELPFSLQDLIAVSKRIIRFREFTQQIQRDILKAIIKRIQLSTSHLKIEYTFPTKIQSIKL